MTPERWRRSPEHDGLVKGTVYPSVEVTGTVTTEGYANAVVALDAKTLTIKDWFTQPGIES